MPNRLYPNSGKRWTKKEVDEIYHLIMEEGYSIKTLSKKYGRTQQAIVAKLNKEYNIGLTDPYQWSIGK